MATGWNFHELYLWHDPGRSAGVMAPGLTVEPGEHYENAETKRRFRNLVEVSGLLGDLVPVPSTPVSEDDLAQFHTRDHIERIRTLSAGTGGDAGFRTPFGHGSYEIARL